MIKTKQILKRQYHAIKPTLLGAFGGVSLVLEPVLCRPIVVRFREKIFGGIFDDGFVEFDGVLPTPKGPQPAVVAGGCLGEIWSEDVHHVIKML